MLRRRIDLNPIWKESAKKCAGVIVHTWFIGMECNGYRHSLHFNRIECSRVPISGQIVYSVFRNVMNIFRRFSNQFFLLFSQELPIARMISTNFFLSSFLWWNFTLTQKLSITKSSISFDRFFDNSFCCFVQNNCHSSKNDEFSVCRDE